MRRLIMIAWVLTLGACSQIEVSDYLGESLVFDPDSFFNGPLVAEGVVRDRKGRVLRYFQAEIDAKWKGEEGVLDEIFYWNDGEEQKRTWVFRKTGDQQFEGSAGDVVGSAKMAYAGNAINMNYVLQVSLESGNSIDIRMDDWLYQVSDSSLINITKMKKFGFVVGEVILVMRKVDD